MQTKNSSPNPNKDSDGFTKVPIRRRHTRKTHATQDQTVKSDPQNQFSVLASQDPQSNSTPTSQDPPLPPTSSLNRSAPLNPPDHVMFAANPFPHMKNVESESNIGPSSPSKGKALMKETQPETDMDLDAALAMSLHEIIAEEEHNPPTEMEEDQYNKYLEELDISKIDLSILETACKQKEYNSIAPWQIDRLEEILTMAQQQKGLGIQGGSQWDGKKLLKETKKRGRKIDLQRTILVGETLMNSGRFPKLTKFFKPKSQFT